MTRTTKNEDLLDIFKELGVDFFPDMGNFRYCPTGEEYMTVVSSGVRMEGQATEGFDTEQEAFNGWVEIIKAIVFAKRGGNERELTVYWRRMPEMLKYESVLSETEKWSVFSRLLISSKPVIQDADYHRITHFMIQEGPDKNFNKKGSCSGFFY